MQKFGRHFTSRCFSHFIKSETIGEKALNRVVLDASVVLKWYLVDEEYGHHALNLLDHYYQMGVSSLVRI